MQNFIYFSSDEWSGSLKTSQYHVAVGLARENRVLYINSIGLRSPQVSKNDFRKITNKLKGWFRGVKQVMPNLFVITPIIIPFHELRLITKLNQLLLIGYIKYYQRKLGLKNPILITFLPNVIHYIGSFHEKKVVYYCADQMSSFRGVPLELVRRMEHELIRRADLVLATSLELYHEKKLLNPNTHFFPHGVDFELFQQAQSLQTQIPADIQALKHPIIGFFGLISEEWVDYELISFLATSRPDWNLLLIGKIDGAMPPGLTQLSNIHFLGARPYEQLPAYSKAFDVAIIPFLLNELAIFCNPIKVKEYLAAGKPVVSVDLPSLHALKAVVHLAQNQEDFLAKIEAGLQNDSPAEIQKRMAAVRDDTWAARVEIIQQLTQ
ncbi:glycosyltransferase [candidate division KSB1 bacterium]|nr:glycosyltransferase [candidate division KSB1 bacterium]